MFGGPCSPLSRVGVDMAVNGETTHRHGGFRRADFTRLGVGERAVLDFSVNLNPLGPPSLIRDRWPHLISGIEDYPSVEGEGVSYYYQKKYGIEPDHFLAGNGSTEMIYLIPRALGIKKALVPVPSFHDYSRASRLAGASVLYQPISQREHSFAVDIGGMMDRMRDSDALWLGNPNNPTGNLHPKETILEICRRYPDKWVIVDEAFMPFVEKKNLFCVLDPDRPGNLLVLHSLTKFYALAGIRMGGVIASREVIRALRRFKEPWTVNGIAERIAPLLLECGEYEEKTLSLIRAERSRLFENIRRSGVVFPSIPSANFLLCQWRFTENLDDCLKELLALGIYVRDCRNFPGLEKNWFRLAVKTPEENDRLLSAFSSFTAHRQNG